MLLQNEIAIITGGASERGIGRGIATLFVEQGARVAILDLDGEAARDLADSFGKEHRGYPCNVTNRDEVEAAA